MTTPHDDITLPDDEFTAVLQRVVREGTGNLAEVIVALEGAKLTAQLALWERLKALPDDERVRLHPSIAASAERLETITAATIADILAAESVVEN